MMELEQLARLHAALQAGAAWDELLRKERLTRAQWMAAERAWLEALGTEAAAGRWELCDRYLQALSGKSAEGRPHAPAPANDGAIMPAGAGRPVERPTYEIAAAAAVPAALGAAAPLVAAAPLGAAALPAAMARFTEIDGTQMASGPAPAGDALPFVPGTPGTPGALPPPSAPAAWMPKAMRGLSDVGETQIASEAPAPAPLPFEASATSSAAAPPATSVATVASGGSSAAAAPATSGGAAAIPVAMRKLVEVDGTQIASSVPVGPALPFAPGSPTAGAPASARAPASAAASVGGAGPAPAPPASVRAPTSTPSSSAGPPSTGAPSSAAAAPTAAPAWMPKSMRAFADVDGTQIAPDAPAGPALPFAPDSRHAAPPPAAPRSVPPLPTATPTLPPAPAPPPPPAAATAPPRAPAPTLMAPALSLEQYASLCVELDLDPGKRLETLHRYRVTEAQHGQLDAHFRARIAADPALRASFEAARGAYHAWLMQSRGAR